MPPARELRDHHKDLWLKFGREEAATIRQEYPLMENTAKKLLYKALEPQRWEAKLATVD